MGGMANNVAGAPGVSVPTANNSVVGGDVPFPMFLTTALNVMTSVVVGMGGVCVNNDTTRSGIVLLKGIDVADANPATVACNRSPVARVSTLSPANTAIPVAPVC